MGWLTEKSGLDLLHWQREMLLLSAVSKPDLQSVQLPVQRIQRTVVGVESVRSVNYTAQSYLMVMLGMAGAVPLLPTRIWRGSYIFAITFIL